MASIKHKSLSLGSTMGAKEILGKKVPAPGGKRLGSVADIRLHPKKWSIEGIRIGLSAFLGDYVGKNYIKSVSKYGVILKVRPSTEYMGMKVLDSTGKFVGKVSKVMRSRKSNNVNAINVLRPGKKKDKVFKNADIDAVGEKIMLNKKVM